ncbi:MAG: NADH-quinone oxidoreductase subunit NuoH [Planctomycetota bacterium]
MDAFDLIVAIVKAAVVLVVTLSMVPVSVYLERRISAFIQYRYGPNRVGPFGLLQPVADVVKLVFKEEFTPPGAHKTIFRLAPFFSAAPAFLMMCVVPFGDPITVTWNGEPRTVTLCVADVDIGLLLILAASSMAVYGITLAGWSSGSKYSLLGGLRSSAQMISYELAMGLAIIGVLLVTAYTPAGTGSFKLIDIVHSQVENGWNVIRQPLGFLIFIVAAFAETNRLPFDLPEAEPELVAGFHAEYSAMKFSLFFMGEYAAMVVASAMLSVLFFGGWHLPFAGDFGLSGVLLALVQVAILFAKILFFVFLFIQVRWTLPRFRYDQLMNIGWKVMLPAALVNILLTGAGVVAWPE